MRCQEQRLNEAGLNILSGLRCLPLDAMGTWDRAELANAIGHFLVTAGLLYVTLMAQNRAAAVGAALALIAAWWHLCHLWRRCQRWRLSICREDLHLQLRLTGVPKYHVDGQRRITSGAKLADI